MGIYSKDDRNIIIDMSRAIFHCIPNVSITSLYNYDSPTINILTLKTLIHYIKNLIYMAWITSLNHMNL